jgi:hypothetical protein
LVPNTNITMTKTINQCQMLNEPILNLLGLFFPGARTAHHMQMQVINLLPSIDTIIHH